MKLKLAPCLLLSVLQCDPATAFTTPSHAASIQTFLSNSYNYHDSEEYYHEDGYYYQQHSIPNEPDVDFSRRDASGAFFRGLTAAGAVGAASSVLRPQWARAAEFSDGNFGSTTSGLPPAAAADAAPVTSSPAQQVAEAASTSMNYATMQYRNSLAEMDPNILAAGAVATVGFFGVAGAMQQDPQEDSTTAAPAAASTASTSPPKPAAEKPKWHEPPTPYGILNKNQNPFAEKAATPIVPKVTPGAPPPGPYGLAAGRNYWDGKVLQTAAELPKPPPPPKPAQPAPPAAPAVAQTTNGKETRKWYEPPTPYGILNKDKNPFLKDIQQYCEPGKVSQPCTDSIKGYLSDLSASGATASGEAAGAIVGYLDSLGGKKSSSSNAAVGNAAFTNYLDALSGSAASTSPAEAVIDALSNGSTPSPASAQAVKEYLDSLNIAKKPAVTGMVMTPPKKMPTPSSSSSESYSAYDNRLTSIENRVSTLEDRVNDLPDEVYNRMEEWRSRQESKLDGEVGRLVGMMNSKVNGTPVNGASPVPPSQPPPPPPAVSMGKRGRGMGGYLDSLNP
ncbi:hypothetical protein HJC23_006975 [Cyclotella cryptica]|uniref:Diatom pyrenoid component 2 domain-containing protein n=1 Tax=Cyclotella cryptica TaxID=29204 RepID=A0ABD3QM48_9STRA|eukprot:CCRYP_004304-RA/>CCRYP_004304-RA protein AED:0.12 eAED:0.12 QI:0/-1/0/1/-1/1/1/0/561